MTAASHQSMCAPNTDHLYKGKKKKNGEKKETGNAKAIKFKKKICYLISNAHSTT